MLELAEIVSTPMRTHSIAQIASKVIQSRKTTVVRLLVVASVLKDNYEIAKQSVCLQLTQQKVRSGRYFITLSLPFFLVFRFSRPTLFFSRSCWGISASSCPAFSRECCTACAELFTHCPFKRQTAENVHILVQTPVPRQKDESFLMAENSCAIFRVMSYIQTRVLYLVSAGLSFVGLHMLQSSTSCYIQ